MAHVVTFQATLEKLSAAVSEAATAEMIDAIVWPLS